MTQQAELTFDDLLDSIPVANRAVKADQLANGLLRLHVPFHERWWMKPPFSYILPFGPGRRLELDALGQEVWRAIDGMHRTEQLIETFSQRHRVSFHEARLAVCQFLHRLAESRVIVVQMPPRQAEPA